jgi:hypothetical protein
MHYYNALKDCCVISKFHRNTNKAIIVTRIKADSDESTINLLAYNVIPYYIQRDLVFPIYCQSLIGTVSNGSHGCIYSDYAFIQVVCIS